MFNLYEIKREAFRKKLKKIVLCDDPEEQSKIEKIVFNGFENPKFLYDSLKHIGLFPKLRLKKLQYPLKGFEANPYFNTFSKLSWYRCQTNDGKEFEIAFSTDVCTISFNLLVKKNSECVEYFCFENKNMPLLKLRCCFNINTNINEEFDNDGAEYLSYKFDAFGTDYNLYFAIVTKKEMDFREDISPAQYLLKNSIKINSWYELFAVICRNLFSNSSDLKVISLNENYAIIPKIDQLVISYNKKNNDKSIQILIRSNYSPEIQICNNNDTEGIIINLVSENKDTWEWKYWNSDRNFEFSYNKGKYPDNFYDFYFEPDNTTEPEIDLKKEALRIYKEIEENFNYELTKFSIFLDSYTI